MKTQLTLVDLTGILGVGSLQFLAFYLFYGNILTIPLRRDVSSVDAVGSAVLLTIPTIVTMYILGLLSVLIADQILLPFYRRFTKQGSTRILVFTSESQMLKDAYEESVRHQRLLKGSLLAFLGLAVALTQIGHMSLSLLTSASLLAAMCPFLALRMQRQLDELAAQLCEESRVAQESSTCRNHGVADPDAAPAAVPQSVLITETQLSRSDADSEQ